MENKDALNAIAEQIRDVDTQRPRQAARNVGELIGNAIDYGFLNDVEHASIRNGVKRALYADRPETAFLNLVRLCHDRHGFPPVRKGFKRWEDGFVDNAIEATSDFVSSYGAVVTQASDADDYGENLDRDKWLYDNRPKMTLPQLEQNLERLAKKRAWTPIGTAAIRKAVKRYVEHFGLPVPKGQSGRPKT